MKFCEKLQKLRKDKGYSQEELADLLDVSRQSVSKWESGTTYPEMDKLLSLCKIFNVSLDDLTNDDVSTTNIKEKKQNNFSNLVYAIPEMFNKSIDMFKSMSKKDIAKCITELLIVFLILLIFRIPFEILNDSISNIFINFSSKTYSLLFRIWMLISNVIYLVLFIAIFLYVYKTRFLDKFNPSETKEKSEEEPSTDSKSINTDVIEKTPREKHSFIIFDVLGSIFNFLVKMCLFFVTIPVVCIFTCLVILTFLALAIQFMKINYIGFFVALLGGSLICYVFMEVLIRWLFSSPLSFKRLFSIFTIGLIVGSLGAAIITVEVYNTKYIDSVPEGFIKTSYEETIKMDKDLLLNPHYYFNGHVSYEEDESLKDEIKVTILYYKDFVNADVEVYNNYLNIHNYSGFNEGVNAWNLVKKGLQEKTFYNYNELSKVDIIISTSSKNLKTLDENQSNHYKKEIESEQRYEGYISEINRLEEDVDKKDEQILKLEEEIERLNDKLNNIQSAFE